MLQGVWQALNCLSIHATGIFRISVRRGQCAVGVEGVEYGGGAGQLPEKTFFRPQNDKFGCILPQFLMSRKHGSLGSQILQFNREIIKLAKNNTKIIQKFTVRLGGGRTIAP